MAKINEMTEMVQDLQKYGTPVSILVGDKIVITWNHIKIEYDPVTQKMSRAKMI